MNIQHVQQARAALDRALVCLQAGLPQQAMEHLKQALAIKPDLAAARMAEAQLHLRQNRPEQALAALDANDQYHPEQRDVPHLALIRAEALAGAGQAPLALRLLQTLCFRYPDDVRPHRILAGLALAQNQPELASQHLVQVLRLEPSDSAGRRALVQLLADKDPQTAAELLLSDRDGAQDPAQRLWAARLLHRIGRDRESEDILHQLLTDQPQDAVLWLEAGRLADDMGADDLAVRRLERALTLGAGSPARLALAQTHMHAGRFGPAAHLWFQLAQQTHTAQAWAGLWACGFTTGRPRLCQRAQRMLEVHASRQERRQILSELWRHAAAGQALTAAANAQPSAARTVEHSPLTELLAKSAKTFEEHLQRWPDRADVQYHLATCRLALGHKQEAAQAVDTALRINPRYIAALKLSRQIRRVRRAA